MNVEVESLPNCIASMRVELPPDRVTKGWNEIVEGFRQHARIPGFRPGKAPQNVVEAKFRKEIQEELTKKLVSETTREAIRDKGLKVLSVSSVENVEFTPEKSLRFTATLVTSPEFELPDYNGIPVKVPSDDVTEEEIAQTIEGLRERHASFSDVTGRTLEMGDFAVIDYSTTLDGKPLLEAEPKAPKMLSGGQDFWIKLEEATFLKGFSDHLMGQSVEESREFDLPVPEEGSVAELAGKQLHFQVKLKAIKKMELPEANDEFADGVVKGTTLETLRAKIKEQLAHEKTHKIEASKHNQIIEFLVSRVDFELPQSYVKDETRRIMSEIVHQNQLRGVSEEVLRNNQKEIVSTASRNAKDRLKANFVLTRIAEKEGIEVAAPELRERIHVMAHQYRVSEQKMSADLEKNGLLGQVREEVLIGKVLDFLTSNARVEGGAV
jgi:trigger factor